MKKFIMLFAATATVFGTQSCKVNAKENYYKTDFEIPDGVTTFSTSIDAFSAIDAAAAFKIEYTQSENPKIELKGESEDLKKVVCRVEKGTLVLERKQENRHFWKNEHSEPIRVTVSSPSPLTGIDLSGACDFHTKTLKSPSLKIECSGASDMKIESAEIAGKVDLDISGASDIHFASLSAGSLALDLSGASDATIADINTQSLSADISGASEITLSGKSGTTKLEASGASTIDADKLTASTIDASASGASSVNAAYTQSERHESGGASRVNLRKIQ